MIQWKLMDHSHSISEREEFLKNIKTSLPRWYVLISTCDRVELYFDDMKTSPACDFVPHELMDHLFSLTSGLASPLVGETPILGQVKEAYFNALEEGRTTKYLNLLFQKAIAVGKKVRSSTGISRGALSHGQAVVELLKEMDMCLVESRVTIIGVNDLNKTIIRYLLKKGTRTILCGNRTYEKARELVLDHPNCEAFRLDNLETHLKYTDVLISATSAPHLIVRKMDMPKKSMMIFDLAVPRDIDQDIGNMKGVTLLNITDIENLVKKNMNRREKEILKARDIIEVEVRKFKEKIRINPDFVVNLKACNQ